MFCLKQQYFICAYIFYFASVMLVFVSINNYFLYLLFVYVAAVSNSGGSGSEEVTSLYNLNESEDFSKEVASDGPTETDKVTELVTIEPNETDKKKNDYKTIVFDLTQEESNQYTSNDAFKILETVKGLEFSAGNMTKFKIWPQGIITYFIDNLSFDKILSDKIREYLDVINSLTGLRFRELPRPPPNDDTRWVLFLNRNGWTECWQYTDTEFRTTGVQRVVIGYDCLDDGGNMADIVMGLLGIPQQHNAPNRDAYVQYNEKAVDEGRKRFYTKVPAEDWLFNDIEYDFLSVTHLPFYKDSIDGSAVLKPLVPVNVPVGETKGFSYSDLHKIRLLYNSITSKGDVKIQLSNCQKLYRPGNKDVVNAGTTLLESSNHDTVNSNIEDNERDDEAEKLNNIEAKDNELDINNIEDTPIAKSNSRPNLLISMAKRGTLRPSTDDPLKWEDINSDDK